MQLSAQNGSSVRLGSQGSGRRAMLRSPAPFSSRSRTRNVLVEAKGKGKARFRQTLTQGGPSPMTSVQQTAVPEVDPDNEEFAIFVRVNSKQAGVPSSWAGPITVVKGGQQANILVKAMQSPWGRALYSKTLIRNIAQAIYQDKEAAIKAMRKSPIFQNVPAKDFVFGFKIRDKSDPKLVLKTENITELPFEGELGGTPIDAFRQFWSPDNLATMFGGSGASSGSQQ